MASIPPTPADKCCTKCGIVKPIAEFYAHSGMAGGYLSDCKACKRAYAKARRKTNPDEMRAIDQRKYAKYRPERHARNKAIYAATRDESLQQSASYYAANREQVKAKSAAYFRANRDAANARRRAYYEAHKAEHAAKAKAWRDAHPDECRAASHKRKALKRGNGGSYTAAEWKAIKAAQDYRCLACGVQEPAITLTVDHVLPLSMGGRNDAANLQALCLACNLRKKDRHIDYRI